MTKGRRFFFFFTAVAMITMNSCAQTLAPDTATGKPSSESPTPAPLQQNDRSMQEGNNLPPAQFFPKFSYQLEDNRIGANAETRHIDARTWKAGMKWMRVIIDPAGDWQTADFSKDAYAITPEDEQTINELLNQGIRIMLVLDVWYPDSRTVDYKAESGIAAYLDWVRFMVRHFKDRVEYYEILNEPNLCFSCPGGMPVPDYVNLVERTVPVIRQEYPQAKIVVGAVPDTRFNDARNWIWKLLDSGVMPLVDGLSWHGMYGAAPADDTRGRRQLSHPQANSYWEDYPEYVEEIKSTAAANGFKGEFMTEEMLWRTPKMPHETEPDGFTDIAAAKYYSRAIVIHLGLDVAPGLALPPDDDMPRAYETIRVLSTIMAGAQPAEMAVELESLAENIRAYAFTLSSGEHLLAVWVDDAAVDEFEAVGADLAIKDVAPTAILTLDPINALQQELIFETEKGGVRIRGLLLQDYPIFLRFEQ